MRSMESCTPRPTPWALKMCCGGWTSSNSGSPQPGALSATCSRGAIGATFGLVVAFVSLSLTTKVWLTVVTVPITVLLVSALAWYFLRDSHHRALEQRWMLYRRRARGLGLTP